MTLLRQLIIAITLLITCLLAGNLSVSVFNARTYFYEQMQVHAKDTATSLAFTIANAAQEKDIAQVNSMVDVIFERGYYRRIVYTNLEQEIVVQRQRPIEIEGVPNWFVQLITLPQPSGRAEVISGWFRLGELEVVGHSGYAYRDLWRVFRKQLWLFAITAALSYGLAGLGLKYLLRPLKKVENQARAICRREFLLQENLPRTRELRRMVIAMNRMVQKANDMFREQVELTETLHRQAHLDPVTQLSNRRDFDARFDAFIKSEMGGSAGLMLLIQIEDMQGFNDRFGREAGDQHLLGIASALRELTTDCSEAILSRRAGADFCVFLPGVPQEDVSEVLKRVFETLRYLPGFNQPGAASFHIGAAFSPAVMSDNQLLRQADTALRQSQHCGVSNWQVYKMPTTGERGGVRLASEWMALLQNTIAARELQFHYQPIVTADGRRCSVEVLCRLSDGEQLYTAGVFLPMVERFNLSVELDKLVLLLLQEDTAVSTTQLCVNLSLRSVQDSEFVMWLQKFLIQYPNFAKRLIFEVPEHTLAVAESAVRQFAVMLDPCDAGLCLDHFGVGTSAFNYLQSVPLRMLKIDRCFIQGIEENPDNQFFVKSLVQIAHSCDVKILAEGVGSQAQWQTLLSLGVDGGQGYFLGTPKEHLSEVMHSEQV